MASDNSQNGRTLLGEAGDRSLGGAARSGLPWAAAGALLAKVLSLCAQVVLGLVLEASDWATYALASSLASLVGWLKDGGAKDILIQKGPRQFAIYHGPVFWMSLATNLVVGLMLFGGSYMAAAAYSDPNLRALMQVLALSVVVNTPVQVLKAKLRLDLRFPDLAKVTMLGAAAQYMFTITFAVLGLGPISFVLPLPLRAIVEWMILSRADRGPRPSFNPQVATWGPLARDVRWILLGLAGSALLTTGDYAVLGFLISPVQLGYYFFAFQLTVQSLSLVTSSVQTVLLPTFSRMEDGPRDRATLNAVGCMVLVCAGASMLLATTIRPLEILVWGGKWKEANIAVVWLCVAMPIRMILVVVEAALKGQGRHKTWALTVIAQALGLLLVAAAAGWAAETIGLVAACIAAYFLTAVPFAIKQRLTDIFVLAPPIRGLVKVTLPWIAGVLTFSLAHLLVAGLLWQHPPSVQILVGASVFGALYLYACRRLAPEYLELCVGVFPSWAQNHVRRLLLLKSAA